jgi:hypothetical protein
VSAPAIKKYQRLPITVDAAQYDGKEESRKKLIGWVGRHRGLAFPASELSYRQDFGTYWHPEHGFVYVPQGARSAGSAITALRDDELIVRTDTGIYAVVFPGDYIVRNRSGFYPLSEESFDRCYQPNARRRGSTIPVPSPAF